MRRHHGVLRALSADRTHRLVRLSLAARLRALFCGSVPVEVIYEGKVFDVLEGRFRPGRDTLLKERDDTD